MSRRTARCARSSTMCGGRSPRRAARVRRTTDASVLVIIAGMLVVLDIGNTAIKFGVFDGDRLVAVERIEGGAAGENLFPVGAVQTATEVVAISSSPANSERLV